jgi:hypothetical protein
MEEIIDKDVPLQTMETYGGEWGLASLINLLHDAPTG